MKIQLLKFIILPILVLITPIRILAQLPDLGTTINFSLFTSVGALGNTGTSTITGNIGSHLGAITGFESPTVVLGSIESANTATAQCLIDVQAVYDEIVVMIPTDIIHAPAFGGGETVVAGIYNIGGAGSVFGDLTLDAEGDTSSIFIFQFGGAFTTAATSTVHLINGASACNIFWIAEGAMSMAAGTDMKGSLISNNGALSMAAGAILEGRMLTTAGATNVYEVLIFVPCATIALPITLLSFEGNCEEQFIILNWSTASEMNNDYFSIERSPDGEIWQTIGKVTGGGNSSSQINYTFIDMEPLRTITYYRLKQTDFNGNYNYEDIISMEQCDISEKKELIVYPNPSNGEFETYFNGDSGTINAIEIFNSQGQIIYSSIDFQSIFNLTNMAPGHYYIQVQDSSEVIRSRFIIEAPI
ncbi:MAG: hypothetical protein ACI8ZM_005352 [Crocinitomix sp.]|jgi:hypothetical protein